MKALIKNGFVIDPINSVKEKKDILIENGIVTSVKKSIKEEAKYVIDAKGMIVSPGFVDLHANFCDPGATDREDLKTGSLAAAKGGYTHVVLGTDNKPAPSESNVIDYIVKYAKIMLVNLSRLCFNNAKGSKQIGRGHVQNKNMQQKSLCCFLRSRVKRNNISDYQQFRLCGR